jgi:hypothetical protein
MKCNICGERMMTEAVDVHPCCYVAEKTESRLLQQEVSKKVRWYWENRRQRLAQLGSGACPASTPA